MKKNPRLIEPESQEILGITLQVHEDHRGKLLAIEKDINLIPFDPIRVYFIYDVASGQRRGGHAVDCPLFILTLQGEASLLEYQRDEKKILPLKPGLGYLVPANRQFELINFHRGTVLSVFAPKQYKDTNYMIRKAMK
ncbi:MAG: WxcM-like domain-containing protein [Bacteroidia bacterium]|nr:WxcM-like domain-containing protein [Bacteroidia bacterium]